ncbi:hypothetical protein L6452_02677 [Arctium lappa]|uniref:Uncharacterized protein n=1 Tax=Arctium lappa TaxID=4217 RepID=A0ACB9FK26_ARCLA|nr:hypothetical protein L6452_02677 [Arctium lappa]
MAEGTCAAKQMEECLSRLKNHDEQIHSIAGLLKDLNLKLTTMEAKLDQSIMSKSEGQETDGSVKGDANLLFTLCPDHSNTTDVDVNNDIQQVLDEFSEVFAQPMELPPS